MSQDNNISRSPDLTNESPKLTPRCLARPTDNIPLPISINPNKIYEDQMSDPMSECDDEPVYNLDDSTDDLIIRLDHNVTKDTDFDRELHLGNLNNSMKFRQEYEKTYDCRVIEVPRRKEDTGMLSFMSYSTKTLVDEDGENFISDLRAIEEENENRISPLNIHIYIDTTGGRLSTAETISKAMLQYPGRIRTFVKDKAMSAGTIIALCSHEIYLRKHACLGQIDPQIGSYWVWLPANSIAETYKRIDEFQTPWIRDLLKLGVGPAYDSTSRVGSLIERIAEIRKWTPSFLDNIRSNLLANMTAGGFGHDRPYDYYDLQQFWISSTDDSNPVLCDDWPRSAKLLTKSGFVKLPEPTKSSYMSMFGL